MTTFKRWGILTLLALTGCATSAIRGQRVTGAKLGPYRKVLVCMIDTQYARRSVVESVMAKTLRTRPLGSKTCTQLFGDLASISVAQMQSRVQQAGFDAILVWHRRPIIHVGGRARQNPSFTELLQAYRTRAVTSPLEAVESEERSEMPIQEGAEEVVEGELHLADVHTGRTVWNGVGAVLEARGASLEDAAGSLAQKAVRALLKDKLVP